MGNFRNSVYKFMQGRYGPDNLYKFLMLAFIIIWILNRIIKSTLFYYLGLAIAVWMMFRFFSRNIEKRIHENDLYLKIKQKVKSKFNLQNKKWQDRKTHIYRKCPNCKNNIRLPRKKGKHSCICPCCKKEFKVKC